MTDFSLLGVLSNWGEKKRGEGLQLSLGGCLAFRREKIQVRAAEKNPLSTGQQKGGEKKWPASRKEPAKGTRSSGSLLLLSWI